MDLVSVLLGLVGAIVSFGVSASSVRARFLARKRFAEKLHENLDADLAKDEQKLATSILEFVDRKSLKHEKAEYTAAELSLNKSLSELSDQEAQALIKNFAGETERAKAAIARIIAHSVVGMRS